MFGVVLWSDPQERKAVIWCEDHGDLAFFDDSRELECREFSLDTGDLVSFEVCMSRDVRVVCDPRIVTEGLYPDLPAALNAKKPACPDIVTAQQAKPSAANIIPFRPRHTEPVLPERKTANLRG